MKRAEATYWYIELIGNLTSTRRNNAAGIRACVHHIDWNLQRTPLVTNQLLFRALDLPTPTGTESTNRTDLISFINSDRLRPTRFPLDSARVRAHLRRRYSR